VLFAQLEVVRIGYGPELSVVSTWTVVEAAVGVLVFATPSGRLVRELTLAGLGAEFDNGRFVAGVAGGGCCCCGGGGGKRLVLLVVAGVVVELVWVLVVGELAEKGVVVGDGYVRKVE